MSDTETAPRPKITAVAATLRFLELLGAAALVGGLAATAAIGVTAFRSPDILTHEQAGRFMARVFEGSLYVEAAAFFVAAGAGRIRLRAQGLQASWLASAVLLVGLFALISHTAIGREMRAIREAHGGTLEALARDDPDRVRFARLHGAYNTAALALLGAGLGVLADRSRAEGA